MRSSCLVLSASRAAASPTSQTRADTLRTVCLTFNLIDQSGNCSETFTLYVAGVISVCHGQLVCTSKEGATLTVILLHKLLAREEPRVQSCDNGGEVCLGEVDWEW